MTILKNNSKERKNEIVLIDNEDKKIVIHYAGGDLYWTMLNYNSDNIFYITKNEKELYFEMEELFEAIKLNDNIYFKLLNNNTFEWISEAYGTVEEQNKLTITKEENTYIIKFYQNPNRLGNKNLCPICFCLSGSRNLMIVGAFSKMYHNIINQNKKE